MLTTLPLEAVYPCKCCRILVDSVSAGGYAPRMPHLIMKVVPAVCVAGKVPDAWYPAQPECAEPKSPGNYASFGGRNTFWNAGRCMTLSRYASVFGCFSSVMNPRNLATKREWPATMSAHASKH